MSIRLKFSNLIIPYIIAFIVGITEFYILYHSDLPPRFGYSPLPKQIEINKMFNVANVGIIGLYTYLIVIPLELVYLLLPLPYEDFSSANFLLSFIIAFMSVFIAIRYYLKKYLNAGNFISAIIAILVDISFQITYYNYWIYPALYLLVLTIYDYGLDFKNLNWKESIRKGLILALGTSLGFQDPRGMFYTTLTFFAYLAYYVIINKRKIEYLKNFMKVFIFAILFLIGLDYQLFVATYLLSPYYITTVAVTNVYNQIGMPLIWYHPLYTLLGTINWTGPLAYNSNLLLGALAAGIAFVSLLERNRISLFFSIMLLAIVTYDFVGTRTIGYILANSPYVGYLIYLYVQYIPDYLYSAYFYSLFAFSLYKIYSFGLGRRTPIKRILLLLSLIHI